MILQQHDYLWIISSQYHCDVVHDELEMAKVAQEEVRRVEKELGEMPNCKKSI